MGSVGQTPWRVPRSWLREYHRTNALICQFNLKTFLSGQRLACAHLDHRGESYFSVKPDIALNLVLQGYQGKGIELRERRTWPTYPPETRAALVEQGIDPPSWFPDTLDEWIAGDWNGRDQCPIQEGMFLIGNHADEMTVSRVWEANPIRTIGSTCLCPIHQPWLPLLSLIPKTPSPFLSLPCCLHTLNGAFTLSKFVPPEPHAHMPPADFEEGLGQGESRYKAYLKWLGWMGLKCGWIWEKEPLRVPSTKSWGIIGE
jgi:tRNASer (uridine44-2'-O)-methyltransferase